MEFSQALKAEEKIDEPDGSPLLKSKEDVKKPVIGIENGNAEHRFAEKPIGEFSRIGVQDQMATSSLISGKSLGDSETASDRGTEKSCLQKLVSIFDFDILKNPTFLNLLLGLSLFYVAEVNFKVLSPFFLASIGKPPTTIFRSIIFTIRSNAESGIDRLQGMARNEVASALTLTAFADVLCRLTVPTVVMRLKLKNRHVFWASSILIGISRSGGRKFSI